LLQRPDLPDSPMAMDAATVRSRIHVQQAQLELPEHQVSTVSQARQVTQDVLAKTATLAVSLRLLQVVESVQTAHQVTQDHLDLQEELDPLAQLVDLDLVAVRLHHVAQLVQMAVMVSLVEMVSLELEALLVPQAQVVAKEPQVPEVPLVLKDLPEHLEPQVVVKQVEQDQVPLDPLDPREHLDPLDLPVTMGQPELVVHPALMLLIALVQFDLVVWHKTFQTRYESLERRRTTGTTDIMYIDHTNYYYNSSSKTLFLAEIVILVTVLKCSFRGPFKEIWI